MSIKYCLLPNHLSSKANAHRALVQGARPATVAEVIDRMTARGSGITKAGILGVFEAAQSVIEDLLLEGRGITSEFINIMPSVRGIFDGADDRFDPARHTVRINVFPGARLQKTTADMRLQKVLSMRFKMFSPARRTTSPPVAWGCSKGPTSKFVPKTWLVASSSSLATEPFTR